ncbi:UDP-Glycosyltransferase/glycogen phosphorylase [Fistulina hepatica ATCC 64428]|uniref:UDP-Glycosyltransferase/glycogen phosphorylase n=1 Tax=Fistulina hepatica ATCC 64428 TaxID=1128425 RepID=A0A0D7A9Q7_9AGAR|nr:UDP-Glycosyltransferase/glycogen phosphorylase [Fistulina hepatica ATCC 64428]
MVRANPPAHFVFGTSPLLGHTRPIFSLAVNLLEEHPDLHATIIGTGTTSPVFSPPFEREIALANLNADMRSRLHVVLLGEGECPDNLSQIQSLFTHLPGFLNKLVEGKYAPDPDGEPLQPPTLAVIDGVINPFIDVSKDVIARSSRPYHRLPVLIVVPTDTLTQYLYWCPNEQFPDGYWPMLYDRAKKATGKDDVEDIDLRREVYKLWNDRSPVVIDIFGFPKMFHYEILPQSESIPHSEASFNFAFPDMSIKNHYAIQKADGVLLPWSPALCPGLGEHMTRKFHIPHLQMGPQFRSNWWKDGIDDQVRELFPQDHDILAFLDRCKDEYGSKSVLYVSFGTLFAPSERPELLTTLVDTLLESDPPLPFLFAGGYAQHFIPDSLRERVFRSKHGKLVTTFVPQQAVLKHEATGWFLSHAGSNSTNESILNGIPMILWPFTIDQPIIAAQLSLIHRVAFELLEVRTGPNRGQAPYRRQDKPISGKLEDVAAEMRDLWVKIRGQEGAEMRERVLHLRDRMREDWSHGGAKKAIQSFSQFLQPTSKVTISFEHAANHAAKHLH